MFALKGRTALVTGAGRGVGKGIARALAEAGASVAVNDLLPERAAAVAAGLSTNGARICAAPFDVRDAAAVQTGVQKAAAELGRPADVLIANAGIPAGMGLQPFAESAPAEWRAAVELNIYGLMNCCRALLPGMRARGFGRIVCISSDAGRSGMAIGVAPYAAGKGGQIAFMRHLALENAAAGITANTLCLGLMEPEGGAAEGGDASAASADEGAQAMADFARGIPLGRMGRPADAAAACVFFASDEACWITGQTLGVNGGAVTS